MVDFDLIIRGARVVTPGDEDARLADIGIRDGRIAAVGDLEAGAAGNVFTADGLLAFPGAVDAHQHWGIYRPLALDTQSESGAAAQGGVTTALNYIRTGQYYMNTSGPYSEVFPAVLRESEGNAYVDYGFHLAPMMGRHIEEIPELIDEFGVTSFKIFMFYGGHGLHGASDDQSSFLMTPPGERYDLAHFEFVMRGIENARRERPEIADAISLSLHCEVAEIMTAYTKQVQREGALTGLAAYHASRPPHSEGLAVTIASYLAHETQLPAINLLHLSSRKAIEAAMAMAATFPEVDFRREVTIGHLLADIDTADGIGGKVNPPLRPREDVEALWEHLLAGHVSWVSSDHACCQEEQKFGTPREDVFAAKSGFGGAEYLLAGLVSEGGRRGLTHGRIAQLVSTNPARRFGLAAKGMIAEGYDADIALVHPNAPWTITAGQSLSSQEYTPFAGLTIDARVLHTFLRGELVFTDGKVVGAPRGRYLHRPTGRRR